MPANVPQSSFTAAQKLFQREQQIRQSPAPANQPPQMHPGAAASSSGAGDKMPFEHVELCAQKNKSVQFCISPNKKMEPCAHWHHTLIMSKLVESCAHVALT